VTTLIVIYWHRIDSLQKWHNAILWRRKTIFISYLIRVNLYTGLFGLGVMQMICFVVFCWIENAFLGVGVLPYMSYKDTVFLNRFDLKWGYGLCTLVLNWVCFKKMLLKLYVNANHLPALTTYLSLCNRLSMFIEGSLSWYGGPVFKTSTLPLAGFVSR